MREKLETTRLQRLRNTDPIFFAHIIEAITEKIEKVEVPDKPVKGFIWRAGFEGAKKEILDQLK